MAGASFILAINIAVALLFAAAFLFVGAHNKADRVANWLALGYGSAIVYLISEFVLPMQEHPQFAYVLGFTGFLCSMLCLAVGIARHYRVPVPWRLLGLVTMASILANWLAFDAGRQSLVRMLSYQAPYALVMLIAALLIVRSKRRRGLDWALGILLALSAAQFLSKPFMALLLGGSGDTPQTYITSLYALYSQTSGAVLQVGTGLLMLTLLLRDMIIEITERSETDALSGAFNRRGFELRALPAITAVGRDGIPAVLVACDLDHFKRINDSYGHEVGDQVISRFARLLRGSGMEHAVVGRMGGEEFMVLIPGANLAGGRLFAEAVRAAFARMPIGEGVESCCTASFGVAEAQPQERLPDVRRRADGALYQAKRNGRDQVCVAGSGANDAMPEHPLQRSA